MTIYYMSKRSVFSHLLWRKRDTDPYGQEYVVGHYWIKQMKFNPDKWPESFQEISEEKAKELFPLAF